MDADLTIKILKNLQEDFADFKTQLAEVKTQLAETGERLAAVERKLGVLDYRLSNVEGVVVEGNREIRALVQIVKQHEHRITKLEDRP